MRKPFLWLKVSRKSLVLTQSQQEKYLRPIWSWTPISLLVNIPDAAHQVVFLTLRSALVAVQLLTLPHFSDQLITDLSQLLDLFVL